MCKAPERLQSADTGATSTTQEPCTKPRKRLTARFLFGVAPQVKSRSRLRGFLVATDLSFFFGRKIITLALEYQ
jgi:hypothetical protein